MAKEINRPSNRAARREKPVRTAGYAPKAWTKWAAGIVVFAMLFMGMLAGAFTK